MEDKRDEVRLLRLVGAPAPFIVGPVLAAGTLLGLAGGLLALVVSRASIAVLAGAGAAAPWRVWIDLLLGADLPALEQLLLLLAAAVAGTVAAGLSAGREVLR